MTRGAGRGQREAEDTLLGDADVVDPLAVVVERDAGALVDQPVAAHEVGAPLGQPDRAGAVLLLVDHRDEDQIAAVRSPTGAGSEQAATTSAAVCDFMSSAPRPQT